MSDNRYAEPIFHFLLCILYRNRKTNKSSNNINNILQFYKKSVTIKSNNINSMLWFYKKD